MKTLYAFIIVLLVLMAAYWLFGGSIGALEGDIKREWARIESDLGMKSAGGGGAAKPVDQFGNYVGYAYRFPYLHYPWYRRLGYYGRVYGLPFFLAGPVGRHRYYYNYPHATF